MPGEQTAGEERQSRGEDGDQHHRAEHPRGLTAAATDELNQVEDREDGEGEGLQGDDGSRHQRGRAKGWDRGAVGAHEDRA